jgi:hypothetical protein
MEHPPFPTHRHGTFVAASKIDYDTSGVRRGGVTWLDDVEEEKLDWLWRGYIPFRKVTLLDGDPGIGKSTLSLDLVARFSRGVEFPFAERHLPRGVTLIVSGEDDIADTIKPRLRAAGADMSRVATLALRTDPETGVTLPFSVPEDMPSLSDALGESEAAFVIIDPITAFLSERVQSHNDASVRKAMTPLTQLAQKSGAAFLLLRHLNKDTSVGKALYRGGGSIAFSGSARSVLLAAEKPEGDGVMVLAQTKGNLAKRGQARSVEWRLVSWDEDPDIPQVKWLGVTELSADDLLRSHDGRRDDHAQRDAVAFLRLVLADGPKPSKEVAREARGAGITETTLKRARDREGVHAYRERDDEGRTKGWWQHLTSQECPPECHHERAS